MIKLEHTEVVGWEAAIRGMRNPMNSWEKGDSDYRKVLSKKCDVCMENTTNHNISMCDTCWINDVDCSKFLVGPNDLDLMKRLRNAGTDHRKFMRMLVVYVDITAPLYWWKEFSTYRAGVKPGDWEGDPMDIEMNSCSTMHKITDKEFTFDDFSYDHLLKTIDYDGENDIIKGSYPSSCQVLGFIIKALNANRLLYLETKDKKYWWQLIQLLPTSYNQKRTIMLNYEVLANIYKSRKNHKLDEWDNTFKGISKNDAQKNPGFIQWIETLPYSELITGDYRTINEEEKVNESSMHQR